MSLYVISGCPRSGTSLMMDIFRHALGEDRMLGFKFCRPEEPEEITDPRKLKLKAWYEYCNELKEGKPKEAPDEDMNPNGFWEDGRFTVRGLTYKENTKDIIKTIQKVDKILFAKIVSSGLHKTDPAYVNRVVYMLRHPRAVAKSQERLRRATFIKEDGEEFNIADEVIHTPEMFIHASIAAAHWFVENPDIPVLFVDFDDLIEEPEKEMHRLTSFIIEGAFLSAIHVVEPKLRRSYPEAVESSLWGEAELTYKLMQEQRFTALIEAFKDPKRLIHRESKTWMCLRFDGPVNEKQCQLCRVNKEYRGSLRGHAEEYKIPWQERPCAYEVAFDLDNPLISIEESIQNNFWEEKNELIRFDQSPRRALPTRFLRRIHRTTASTR